MLSVTKAISLSILLSFALMAQEKPTLVKMGDIAPRLSFKSIMHAPAGFTASWETLKGKIVVLDFWGTWCGPCVAALPHLNALADRYRERPVQFIVITDEEPWRVERFLKIKPISARIWISLATDRSTFDTYGIQALPRVVLVDQKGVIAGLTVHPDQVSETVVEAMLEGRGPSLGLEAVTQQVKPTTSPTETPLLQARIIPCANSVPVRIKNNTGYSFEAAGLSLKSAVAIACNIPPVRVMSTSPLAESTYEFALTVSPERRGQFGPLAQLQQLLATAFGLRVHRETRDVDALVLTVPKAGPGPLRPAKHPSGLQADRGQVTSRGASITVFGRVLEGTLGRVVVDETKLDGLYDLALYWDAERPESVISAAHDQLGLDLVPAKRPIEELVFDVSDHPLEK